MLKPTKYKLFWNSVKYKSLKIYLIDLKLETREKKQERKKKTLKKSRENKYLF